jgi:hypothetical protein
MRFDPASAGGLFRHSRPERESNLGSLAFGTLPNAPARASQQPNRSSQQLIYLHLLMPVGHLTYRQKKAV